MTVEINRVRSRARMKISKQIAQDSDLSLEELKSFATGTFTPPRDKLVKLAKRLGFLVTASSLKEVRV